MVRYSHTFPLPPSVNQLWRSFGSKGRVIKSKAYREWEKLVDGYGYLVPRRQLQGDVRATYRLGRPSARRMDCMNREKAISDTLTRWGVLLDDSQIVDIRVLWDASVPGGMVQVEVEELGAVNQA